MKQSPMFAELWIDDDRLETWAGGEVFDCPRDGPSEMWYLIRTIKVIEDERKNSGQ